MSQPFDFKDKNILKPITIVTLMYSVLMFLKYIDSFLGIFIEPKNPLIPEYLSYYVAFPTFFILPFLGILIFICFRNLKSKTYIFKVVYALFGFAVLFFLFQWKIYDFLMSFNPYTG